MRYLLSASVSTTANRLLLPPLNTKDSKLNEKAHGNDNKGGWSTNFTLINEKRTRVVLVVSPKSADFAFAISSETQFHVLISLFEKNYLNMFTVHVLTMSLKKFAERARTAVGSNSKNRSNGRRIFSRTISYAIQS